jgi:TonB family protein
MYGGLAAHMAESWKQWEGTVVDQFRLEEFLGGSDHSAVFASHLPNVSSQKIVLKFVPATPENLELQRVSWENAARITHPHLIQLHGTGRCRLGNTDFLYLAMEHAEENLAQILPERPLSADEARDMLPVIVATLGELHQRGLVHGALKPANILAANDQLKLASDHVWPSAIPRPAATATPYDPPEFTQSRPAPSADVWSLGATLREVLTQRSPNGNSAGASVGSDALPAPFDGIVRRCLEKDPAQRSTLPDIQRALDASPGVVGPAAVGTSNRPAVATYTPEVATEKSVAGLRWVKLLGAVAVLLVLLYAGSRLLRSGGEAGSTAPTPSPSIAATSESASTPASSSTANTPPPNSALAAADGATPGSVLERVQPNVSASARATITGKIRVRVRVRVDASGNVADAKLESAGPSRYFANKALEASHGWKFTAPQSNGHPVPSQWRLRFEFSRGGTQGFADRLSP